jgi:hypothetical protein
MLTECLQDILKTLSILFESVTESCDTNNSSYAGEFQRRIVVTVS